MEGWAWLHSVYIVCAIFGAAVVLVDSFGLLSGDSDGEDAGEADDVALVAEGGGAVLQVFRWLRRLVYFALGFGGVGLGGLLSGWSPAQSLLWSIPAGLVAVWLARLCFRLQQSSVDSHVASQDLLWQQGDVIVPMTGERMGRVRVQMGPVVVERFAYADSEIESFNVGERVEIMRFDGDVAYVCRTPIELTTDDTTINDH